MVKDRNLNLVGLTVTMTVISGCMGSVDRASIVINDNNRIDANLTIGSPSKEYANILMSKPEVDQRRPGQIEEEKQRISEQLDQMRNCVSGTVSRSESPFLIRIGVRNQSVEQLRQSIDCMRPLGLYASVDLVNDDGFFQSTRLVKLSIRLPINLMYDGKGSYRLDAPNVVTLEIPNVHASVYVVSPAVNTLVEQISKDSVSIRFVPKSEVVKEWAIRQKIGNNCEMSNNTIKTDSPCLSEPYSANVVIVAQSSINKFGLSEILAFFSILFGSGIAVTLGSRILAIRTERESDSGQD